MEVGVGGCLEESIGQGEWLLTTGGVDGCGCVHPFGVEDRRCDCGGFG